MAGFFLKALLNVGVSNLVGFDTNSALVDVANKQCVGAPARLSQNFHQDICPKEPDVIVAFFVLEHLESEQRASFWKVLDMLPKGTVFIFSVPCVGFSTIFENSFDGFAARNLDNVVHTQMFTDRSITYMLDRLGFSTHGEWLFGQDGQDLVGTLSVRSNELVRSGAVCLDNFNSLVDELQSVFDKHRLCDARHIFCVKN